MIFDPNESLPGQTPIDPDEAQGLIPGHIQTIAELNEFESNNILTAREKYLAGKRRAFSLEDPEFHKRVHREMFGQVWKWAGKYRHSELLTFRLFKRRIEGISLLTFAKS